MDLTLFVCTHRSFWPARKSQRVLGPIADAGQGGAKAQSSPAHGSSLGRLSKNCKKYVSHTYKSKKTPFGTTQQSTRQAPSSSTQTQVEFKLSSSWTQVELKLSSNHDVGGSQRKSRWGETKKSGRQTKKSGRGNCKTCRGIGGFIETALPVSRI